MAQQSSQNSQLYLSQNENNTERLFGFYRGTVLKHLNQGMCKIYIPGVYDQSLSAISNADKLPSAEPAAVIFGGGHHGNGSFSYPNISATVWCFFANGDENYPVFFAETLGGEDAKEQWDEVRNVVPKDSYIHKINCQNEDKTEKSYIKLWESGQIEICASQNEDFSKIVLNGSGVVKIVASQMIVLNSKNIDINGVDQIGVTSNTINVNAPKEVFVKSKRLKTDTSVPYGSTTIVSWSPLVAGNKTQTTF